MEFRSRREAGGHRIAVKVPYACEAELHLPAGVGSEFPSLDANDLSTVKKYRLPAGGACFLVPDEK